MKTVKSLLLGSAAGLVAITGAQAADLPMAEPVEYVKVCSTYGNGYFYVPGTETCLRISGFARFDMIAGDDNFLGLDGVGVEGDNFDMYGRARVTFDARSETEWGTLRGVMQFEGGGFGSQTVTARNAFIQFAGLTAGRVQSFYDYVPYNHFGDLASDDQVDTLAYTFGFGSGFSATVGLEDPGDRRLGGFGLSTGGGTGDVILPVLDADGDPTGETIVIPGTPGDIGLDNDFGQTKNFPNVIAALRIDQAWGSAQLSGALQENRVDDFLGVDDDEWGWAIQGGASVNLPWSEGSLLWVMAGYSEGALSYLGTGNLLGNLGNTPDAFDFLATDFSIGADGDIENNEAWTIGGGIGWAFTPAISANLGVNYLDVDAGSTGGVLTTPDYQLTTVLANVIWSPVQNLDIGVEGIYQHLDADDFGDEDSWGLRTRIQRNF